jgi:predicted negative regulator of RcsB-dependent stress response
LGTTKLTRKEILAEDPVHAAMIQLVEAFRTHGIKIVAGAALALVLIIGIYAGIWYLGRRDVQAGQMLGKGIDLFHAQVSPEASDDPYAKGGTPEFRTDASKYEAAKKEFAAIVSDYGRSGVSAIAGYYLGLTQMKLGQTKEAIQTLEEVGGDSKDLTVSSMAKMALATHYAETGSLEQAQGILEGLMKDPQVQIPRQAVGIQLAHVLAAAGKRDEAIKVLREARDLDPDSTLNGQLSVELNRLEGGPAVNQ